MDGTKKDNVSGDVAAIHSRDGAGMDQHAPNLTSLRCSLRLTPNAPLVLPPKLSALEVDLTAGHSLPK